MTRPVLRVTRKGLVKAYVAYCLCMDSDVFIRLFGHLSAGGAQIGGFQSANPIMLLFTLTLLFSTACFLLPVYRRVLTVLINTPWTTALYAWSLVSVLWAVEPGTVIRLAPPLWAYLLCGVIAGYYLSVEETASVVGNLMSLVALASAVYEKIDPIRDSAAPGWTGLFGEKNHLGMGMGVGIIALLAAPRDSVRFRLPKLALCTVLLLGSQSTTAMGFVLVAATLYALTKLKVKARWLVSSALGLAISGLIFVPHATERIFAASGKDTSFTGRDVIWSFVWQQWCTRPLLGFGYSSFWTSQDDLVHQTLSWNPGSAHNGFLEVLVTLGLPGLLFLVAALISGIFLARRAWLQGHKTAAIWLSMAWVAMMIDDITEADFIVPAPLWFTYCLVFFLTYAELRRHPNKTAASNPAPANLRAFETALPSPVG
jgi:exopolysaccharide production protein ExoQ